MLYTAELDTIHIEVALMTSDKMAFYGSYAFQQFLKVSLASAVVFNWWVTS